jgi:hypothetical protein
MLKGGNNMAKEASLTGVLAWIVGVLVSLAVGSGMIDGTLMVPGIPSIITMIAGWIVVVGAILGVILAIFSR